MQPSLGTISEGRESAPTAGSAAAVAALPLATRIRILTGETAWSLYPIEELGLRAIVASDGPIGVRGVDGDESTSAQLPNPSAVAATWDLGLVARLGRLLAGEAIRKRVDVILAPVVNLQRTPVGGRHFECFSEDPLLTARIATAQIAAAQSLGVAMSVKHFLGNESETERTSYLARIPERALHEVYLAPFEAAVRDAGAWSVMAAYNGVDDGVLAAPATEHGRLLRDVLEHQWGFDGVVVSDWLAAQSTVESALAGLDLVMPGPGGPWEDALLAAVRSGRVAESVINEKVSRILRLGVRVGAVRAESAVRAAGAAGAHTDPASGQAQAADAAATRALLREAVARSIVVLRNEGALLPLAADAIGSVALIGPNAIEPFVQGGGSGYVAAPYLSTPEQALRGALPWASVTSHRGGSNRRHAHPIDPAIVATASGAHGYELTLFDHSDRPVGAASTVPADEAWNRNVPIAATRARIRALVRLSTPGTHRLEVGVSGAHTVRFDGQLVSESTTMVGADVILDSSANHPSGPGTTVQVGESPVVVAIDADLQVVDAEGYGTFVRFELRHDAAASDAEAEIEQAASAAASADVAVVIVGTNEETESEGWDRPDLRLPAHQNELVRHVSAANPRTVVVVNAGAPVILPWLEQVDAVLWWWLPGQEAGNGLVDALLGVCEPSGRLPWTLPADENDVPVPHAVPVDGVVDYTEGIDVGYRGWDRLGRTPAREFGFGLGYGAWQYEQATVTGWHGDELVVAVDLRNAGERDSRCVAQLYLEDPTSDSQRPVRWLAGFTTADVAAGTRERVDIRIPRRSFEIWDVAERAWCFAAGSYRISIGGSSRDLAETFVVGVDPPKT